MTKYKLLETYGKFKLWESTEKDTPKLFKVTYRGSNRGLAYNYEAAKKEFEKIKFIE